MRWIKNLLAEVKPLAKLYKYHVVSPAFSSQLNFLSFSQFALTSVYQYLPYVISSRGIIIPLCLKNLVIFQVWIDFHITSFENTSWLPFSQAIRYKLVMLL